MSMEMLMCAPDNITGAPYTRPLLEIERNFDLCGMYTWHTANWTLCFPFIALYLMVIFAGRQYMKSRPPYKLQGALILWNIGLAVFSIICSWRLVPSLVYSIRNYGFHDTVCQLDMLEKRQAVGVWVFLYVLSKIVEFGDTVFIVLRKSPLIFLHWYHHVTVAFSVWSTGGFAAPMQVYYCTINFAIHSVMYSYFALKALKVPVPKRVSMLITALQLSQMVVNIVITSYAYHAKSEDPSCVVPTEAVVIAGTIILSYFFLFLNFFMKAYFGKKQRQKIA